DADRLDLRRLSAAERYGIHNGIDRPGRCGRGFGNDEGAGDVVDPDEIGEGASRVYAKPNRHLCPFLWLLRSYSHYGRDRLVEDFADAMDIGFIRDQRR